MGKSELQEPQPRILKCCIAILSVFSLAISGSFCILYWLLWVKAVQFNEGNESYDHCATKIPELIDTQWTIVFAYNALLYLGLSIMSIFLLVGAWLWPCRVCGFCGHCCGVIFHILGITLAGVMRYNKAGTQCATTTAFKADGDLLASLFISQCCLLLFYNCCTQFSSHCGQLVNNMMS